MWLRKALWNSRILVFSGLSPDTNDRRESRENLSSFFPRLLGFSILSWLHGNEGLLRGRRIVIVSEGSTEVGERLLRDYFRFKLETASVGDDEKPSFGKETNVAASKKVLTDIIFSPDALIFKQRYSSY